MAGTPISTFLANLHLAHMDHYFADAGILYARYSDDIILFDDNVNVSFVMREGRAIWKEGEKV